MTKPIARDPIYRRREFDADIIQREFLVVDHPHKHHGAACRAMLQLLARTFSVQGAF